MNKRNGNSDDWRYDAEEVITGEPDAAEIARELRLDCLKRDLCSIGEEYSGKYPEPEKYRQDSSNYFHGISAAADWDACCRKMVSRYETTIPHGCVSGTGYYIFCSDMTSCNPADFFATLYVLALAGAKLYVEGIQYRNDAEAQTTMLGCYLMKHVLWCQAETVPDYGESASGWAARAAFIRSHPNIKHVVCFGDSINSHRHYIRFSKLGLKLHLPGALLFYTEYSCHEGFMKDRTIWKFGELCINEMVDCAAYLNRGIEDAESSDYYAGFDYSDLFRSLTDELNIWRSFPQKDRRTLVVFTDKPRSALALPADIDDYCKVYLSNDIDFSKPLYDFSQLLS